MRASPRYRGLGGRLRRNGKGFALMVRRVVMLEDHPERIARGCAAGMATAYLPMLGQTLVGMLLAWCIRGSPLAAMPWSWVSNPLTTVPLWYACYLLGAAILPGHDTLTWHGLQTMAGQIQALSLVDGALRSAEVLGSVYLPMLIGSLLIGLATAIPTWWLVRRAVVAVQARRAARCAHWKTRLVPKAPDATT
jgi:uncharacterized protein (DUF2062 family)